MTTQKRMVTFFVVFLACITVIVWSVISGRHTRTGISYTINSFFAAAQDMHSDVANAYWVQDYEGGWMNITTMRNIVARPTYRIAIIIEVTKPYLTIGLEKRVSATGRAYYPATGFCEPFEADMHRINGKWKIRELRLLTGDGDWDCYSSTEK